MEVQVFATRTAATVGDSYITSRARSNRKLYYSVRSDWSSRSARTQSEWASPGPPWRFSYISKARILIWACVGTPFERGLVAVLRVVAFFALVFAARFTCLAILRLRIELTLGGRVFPFTGAT